MKKRIVCYGDSNTYGYDAADWFGGRLPAEQRWVDLLGQALGAEVFNCGLNGRSVPRWPRAVEIDAALIARYKPELVLVMLGTNDVLMEPDAERIAQSMRAFLLALREKLPEAAILLTAPPLVYGYGDEAAEASEALPGLYEALAEELGIAFADSSTWQIAMGADGVHFSPRGHLVYAVKMAQRIRALGL
jgi:lysophospholipase L1-like esterase